MTILVTRPEPGASRTVAALDARGLDALACPLFTVVPSDTGRPAGKFAALLVTSGHGAMGLTPAAADLAPNLPVFAVGDRTAEAMRANGFTNVTSASGDQKALTALVLSRLSSRYRVLLATGEDHKDGLPNAFAEAGHEIALWLRYRADPVPALPDAARDALAGGKIKTVLHFSRRASEAFVSLSNAAGLAEVSRGLRHVALSADVAEPLAAAGFGNIAVAAQPNEDALLALVADAVPLSTPAAVLPVEAASAGMTRAASTTSLPTTPSPRAVTRATPAKAIARTTEADPSVIEDSPAPPPPPPKSATMESASPANASSDGGLTPRSTPLSTAASPPSAAPRRGIGVGALIGTALASGLIGAAAFAVLGPPLLGPLLARIGLPLPQATGLSDLASRIGRLEAQGAANVSAANASANTALTATVDAAVQAALKAAQPQPSGADAALATEVTRRIAALESRVVEVAARPVTAPQTAELAELRGKLATLEQLTRASGSSAAHGAARLVLTDRLSRALDAGRPFTSELAALTATGAPPEPVAVLTAMAATGVPTLQALIAEFRTLRPILAAEPASAGASWTEQLLRLTDGLVRVRSTGAVHGASPAAVTSRIDEALRRGDSAAAANAFPALPEPARIAAQAWVTRLLMRARAEIAAKAIADQAVAALSAAK